MKQTLFLLLVWLCPLLSFAQLEDTFEDGNFDESPTWVGTDNLFAVQNEMLSLAATEAGTAYLATTVTIADSTSWSFWLQLDFNPSALGNFPKIYLSADNSDLSGSLQGYFLRIGESNTNDAFELYRQDGNSEALLLRFDSEGQMGAGSGNIARLHITRNANGLWSCAADYSGGFCFEDEGSIVDNTYPTGSYFGFFCKYTISNVEDFHFDDVYVDIAPPALNEPLSLENVTSVSNTNLELSFSNLLAQASAEMVNHYSIEDASGNFIGNPATATLDLSDFSLVHLDISNLSINSGETYRVKVNDLSDCAGNSIGVNNSLPFQIFMTEPAEAFDILINEIFADPDVELSDLPDAEYVELYNRSDKAINLQGYTFSDASSSKTLDAFVMAPHSYLILCDAEDEILYSPFGTVMPITGFPALNNSGDELSLANENGNLIHRVSYLDTWYQDGDKSDGGWSLELINPERYCLGASNWVASNAAQGGTPGSQNSVFDNSPDLIAPKLLGAIPFNNHQVRLVFDEIMSEALSTDWFSLSGGTGNVLSAILEMPDKRSILLEIAAPFFENNMSYTISISSDLTDCSGNAIDVNFNHLEFVYLEAEEAAAYDILINEIFADPSPPIGLPEAEYIELYNRSSKNINLENFILADRNDEVLLPYYLLAAGDYVILYKNGEASFGLFGDTLALEDFIGLGNTEDDLQLLNAAGDIVHAVSYNNDWYQDSDKAKGGWSLELINPQNYCAIDNNWRASTQASGGTPGMQNSVWWEESDESPLDLICAYPLSPTTVRLFFNKAVSEEVMLDGFSIAGIDILDIEVEAPLFQTVLLTLASPLANGARYKIHLEGSVVTDCRGNAVGMFNEAALALADEVAAQDVIINEVLFNPIVGGKDFVELYNRSDKVIDLSDLRMANRNETGDISQVEIIETNCLLFPEEYRVLTEAPMDIWNRYENVSYYHLSESSLPSYPDKEGWVVLYEAAPLGALVVDEFAYREDMHYPLLRDKNGVSLERINPNAPSGSPDSWHSAAEEVGFATPTYRNSQFAEQGEDNDDELLWLPVARLSPDNDGFEDFLQILYAPDKPGYTAHIRIYDAKGRLVKKLAENKLLATEGFLQWDGVYDSGSRARSGIHILEAKLVHTEGEVRRYKMAFVVASKLD